MDVWGNGKGTTLLLVIGLVFAYAGIYLSGNFQSGTQTTWFAAIVLGVFGALFVGVSLAIFLTWLLFTDRKLADLFAEEK